MPASAANPARDQDMAYALLRFTLGLNIAMHGLSRILTGPASFAATLLPEFQKTILPVWSVYGFGLALPFVEAILGLLLFVGLATRFSLIAGAVWIMLLTFGSALRQDWPAASTQLLYAFIYTLLLAFITRNRYSLDTFFKSK